MIVECYSEQANDSDSREVNEQRLQNFDKLYPFPISSYSLSPPRLKTDEENK